MKARYTFAVLTISFLPIMVPTSRAVDITAGASGNWGDTNVWVGGIVPGTNDDADIPAGITVTVNTNASVQYIYDDGTVTMAAGATLHILGDAAGAYGAQTLGLLDATNTGNTVIYSGNPFWAKRTDYYNLVFSNTVTPNLIDFYNGPIPGYGTTPMTIARDMTVMGKIKVQQGADITIGGNLVLTTNAQWDSSLFNLTVTSNLTLGAGALLLDLAAGSGSDYIGGNVTVSASAIGWNVSDVTEWAIGGSLTNNGLIVGAGYGSINFNGTGVIAGSKALKIPTMTVNGTYTISTMITLTTNTPTLNGTLVFDLAQTNQIVLLTSAGTALYYSGMLNVINSGATPASGASYKLFNCTNGYDGSFVSTSFPSLPNGLSWVDNTLSTGAIDVIGTSVGSPVLSLSRNGGLLTLSWDSATFPGYSVQAQTNKGGIGTNWSPTGSGTVSPFTIAINPTNPSVFFRLSNP